MRTALMSWLRRHALCMHIPASAAGPAGYDQRRPYAVERAVRAQFCPGFRPFGELRRRRNELEYPRLPADTAREDEATQAIEVARQLITAAKVLLGKLSFFA
jgi:hypothetical protein